jgi:SAM-dependent methyltransferase
MVKQRSDVELIKKIWSTGLDSTPDVYEHERPFMRQMLEIARNSERILEIGSGMGRMLNVLAANGIGGGMYGVDVNRLPAEVPAKGVVGDARRLPFAPGVFDLVFSLGVVEHWGDTAIAVREHARVARLDGHVLVTTPHLSAYTLARWASYLTRREFRAGTFEQVRGRNLTLRYMRKVFAASGLKVVDSGTSGIYSRTLARVLGPAARLLPQEAYLWVLGRRV